MSSWTSTESDKQPMPLRDWFSPALSGILSGVLFGLFFRLTAGHRFGPRSGEMTWAFVVLGPVVVGFLSCFPCARRAGTSLWRMLGLSSASMLFVCLGSAAFLLEGTICIVMLLPIGILLSFLGGLLAYFIGRHVTRPGTTLTCIALLPVLLAPIEAQRAASPRIYIVESQIRIHATPAAVWQQIQSVPAISPAELQPTWTHRIGFPLPIAATLSYPGVGGVRTATFERGLTFFETVTVWKPEQRLAFSIKADTTHIPATTLDEHVTIGGPYFDVLDGEYRIQPLAAGDVLLHLVSHQRLSTDVNGYAGLWSDAIMQNLQTSILQVIQHRSESTGAAYNHQ